MNQHYDAIVVGGGLLGAATAYHLVQAGAKTVLIDRQDAGRATDAGAGIISPETGGDYPDAWFALAAPAADYTRLLATQLAQEQDAEVGYAPCGMLVVAADDDELPKLEAAKERAYHRQQERGTPGPEELYDVSPEVAQFFFPPLTLLGVDAMYSEVAARMDARLFAAALLRVAQTRGLGMVESSVDQLIIEGNRVTGVIMDGVPIRAGAVVIAGGAWSHTFGEQLGVQIPVDPQRGQIIHLDLPGIDTEEWPLVNGFRGHYLVPWPDSRVAVGATRETGSGFAPTTSAIGIRQVLDEALRLAPGLAESQIREIRVGLRPVSVDGLPVLGPVPGLTGIFLCTGHGSTGLTAGPYSGKLVAGLMLGETIDFDLDGYGVDRFISA